MKPLLVLAWGNRARGDDALGPVLLDRLAVQLTDAESALVELQEVHLLQPEHALDLVGRERVLLVDADRAAQSPFEWRPVVPGVDASWTSHALSPAALLGVFTRANLGPPPGAALLALRAYDTELGMPLSPNAEAALGAASDQVRRWIAGDGLPTGLSA